MSFGRLCLASSYNVRRIQEKSMWEHSRGSCDRRKKKKQTKRKLISVLRQFPGFYPEVTIYLKMALQATPWDLSKIFASCVHRDCLQASPVHGPWLQWGAKVHHRPQRPRCHCGIHHQAAVFCPWKSQGQTFTQTLTVYVPVRGRQIAVYLLSHTLFLSFR